jgi:hypothetical protein
MKLGRGLLAATALGVVGFWGGSMGGLSYVASVQAEGGSPPPECTKDHDCNDDNACTRDVCKDHKCERKAMKCDDGKSCTEDTCDPKKGCQFDDQCPDCSKAAASVATLWPPNHKFVNVTVKGVSHPKGHPTTITFHGVAQDEPTNDTGDGNTCPDAMIGQGSASLRAERSGQGDGRVYHLFFKAADHKGHACSGEVTVCVPHDQGRGSRCVDGGPLHDSLSCSPH